MVYFRDGRYGHFLVYTDHKRDDQKYCYRQVGKNIQRVYLVPTGNVSEWRET
jgi:hypothetical protein